MQESFCNADTDLAKGIDALQTAKEASSHACLIRVTMREEQKSVCCWTSQRAKEVEVQCNMCGSVYVSAFGCVVLSP